MHAHFWLVIEALSPRVIRKVATIIIFSLKTRISPNTLPPKNDFIDFTLANDRQFYSSQGDPLGLKELSLIVKAQFKCWTSHVPNLMQMRKIYCFVFGTYKVWRLNWALVWFLVTRTHKL